MKPSRALALKITLVTVLSFIIVSYGLFQARNLIIGPRIILSTPQNGENVLNPLVIVSGSAVNITYISLNDRQIFVDDQGNFSEKLLVPPGYTIIKLEARDKFGRTTTKLIELNYTTSTSTQGINTQKIIQ